VVTEASAPPEPRSRTRALAVDIHYSLSDAIAPVGSAAGEVLIHLADGTSRRARPDQVTVGEYHALIATLSDGRHAFYPAAAGCRSPTPESGIPAIFTCKARDRPPGGST
jgi:hypothetical protein